MYYLYILLDSIPLVNQLPFYKDIGYWISIFIGIMSVLFSYIAYKEASAAKREATKIGNSVKIQSITIDLTEIIQRLDRLSTSIEFADARDLYSELGRRIRRSLSALHGDIRYQEKISEILDSLKNIKSNLDGVKKASSSDSGVVAGLDLYYAVEGDFSNLSGLLADLCGLLEQRTL